MTVSLSLSDTTLSTAASITATATTTTIATFKNYISDSVQKLIKKQVKVKYISLKQN